MCRGKTAWKNYNSTCQQISDLGMLSDDLAFYCAADVMCRLSGAPYSGFPVRRHNSTKVGQKQKLSVCARGNRENWKLYFSVSVIKGPLNFIQQTIIPRRWWISGSAAAATNLLGLQQEPMNPDWLVLSPAGLLVSAAHNAPVTHTGSAALQKSARPALVLRLWWWTSSSRPPPHGRVFSPVFFLGLFFFYFSLTITADISSGRPSHRQHSRLPRAPPSAGRHNAASNGRIYLDLLSLQFIIDIDFLIFY